MVFQCPICQKEVKWKQQLKLHMLTHSKENSLPPETPDPREKPVSFKNPDYQKELERKRLELEGLRIDSEIKKLKAPDIPENTFFKDAMAQQQQHFEQLMKMNEKHNELKLEIEKLKLLKESEPSDNNDFLLELFKYLPQIMAAKNKEKQQIGTEKQKEKKTEVKTMSKLEKKEIMRKLKAIKDGKMSKDDAYVEFCKSEPTLSKMVTKEEFINRLNSEIEKLK